MPLVRIHMLEGRTSEDKDLIATSVQGALGETLGVDEADRYQLFSGYAADDFRHTDTYLGLSYTERLLIIEITFLEGRDDTAKKSLLADINERLTAAGVVGPDDVFIMITETGRANVSFGQGLAQRAA